MTTWLRPPEVSIGSLVMRLWSMSVMRRRIALRKRILRMADRRPQLLRFASASGKSSVIGTPLRTSTSFSNG